MKPNSAILQLVGTLGNVAMAVRRSAFEGSGEWLVEC